MRRVLQAMPERLSERAREQLAALGVTVRLGARVTGIDAEGLDITTAAGPERLASRCIVWAAGVAASPLGRALVDTTGCTLDRAGRVVVGPDLSLTGFPAIQVIGDLAAAQSHTPGKAPTPVPGGVTRRQADGPQRRREHPATAARRGHGAVPLR